MCYDDSFHAEKSMASAWSCYIKESWQCFSSSRLTEQTRGELNCQHLGTAAKTNENQSVQHVGPPQAVIRNENGRRIKQMISRKICIYNLTLNYHLAVKQIKRKNYFVKVRHFYNVKQRLCCITPGNNLFWYWYLVLSRWLSRTLDWEISSYSFFPLNT